MRCAAGGYYQGGGQGLLVYDDGSAMVLILSLLCLALESARTFGVRCCIPKRRSTTPGPRCAGRAFPAGAVVKLLSGGASRGAGSIARGFGGCGAFSDARTVLIAGKEKPAAVADLGIPAGGRHTRAVTSGAEELHPAALCGGGEIRVCAPESALRIPDRDCAPGGRRALRLTYLPGDFPPQCHSARWARALRRAFPAVPAGSA